MVLSNIAGRLIVFVANLFMHDDDVAVIDLSHLLADVADMHIDRPRKIDLIFSPDIFRDILPGVHFSARTHHKVQNKKFRFCQGDRSSLLENQEPLRIDGNISDGDCLHVILQHNNQSQ